MSCIDLGEERERERVKGLLELGTLRFVRKNKGDPISNMLRLKSNVNYHISVHVGLTCK